MASAFDITTTELSEFSEGIRVQIKNNKKYNKYYYGIRVPVGVNCTPKVRHKTFGVQFVYEVQF